MSTSAKITVFQIVGKGAKRMTLSPTQLKETFTEKKIARLKNGRVVRVWVDGKAVKYYGPNNRRAKPAAKKAA